MFIKRTSMSTAPRSTTRTSAPPSKFLGVPPNDSSHLSSRNNPLKKEKREKRKRNNPSIDFYSNHFLAFPYILTTHVCILKQYGLAFLVFELLEKSIRVYALVGVG